MSRLTVAIPVPERDTELPAMRRKRKDSLPQRDRAYQTLRRQIILRRIPEGQPLRESFWTRDLRVNRTALREALSRLCSEGLIVEGPARGYVVPHLTDDDLREICDVRIIVESGAIECLVRDWRYRSEALRPLRALCDELEWMVEHEYAVELVEVDYRFHKLLVQMSGNRRMELIHHSVPQPHNWRIEQGQPAWRETVQTMLCEHRAILDAIQRQEVEEAISLLKQHYLKGIGQA